MKILIIFLTSLSISYASGTMTLRPTNWKDILDCMNTASCVDEESKKSDVKDLEKGKLNKINNAKEVIK